MAGKRKTIRSIGARPAELCGLGAYSRKMLAAAGIHTRAQLQKLGPVAAYIAVVEAGQKPTLNLLWGIAGALMNVHWSRLPADYRSALLLEYDAWCDRRGH